MKPVAEKKRLLSCKRFFPFFITQFLGAFNDNVFRNVLMLLFAFGGSKVLGMPENVIVNFAAMLFILPFFLFAATAGQFADKYEKSGIIRWIKFAEVLVMLLAATAFYFESYKLLLMILFLMGFQSACFAPVKYALLPQHLHPDELLEGNGLVQMGTMLAILVGTIVAGFMVLMPLQWVSLLLLVVALAGWFCSFGIPVAEACDKNLTINWNPFSQTWQTLTKATENKTVFLSILGISWFWLLGSAYLTQVPNFTRETLHAQPQVATLMLALFSLGIGGGSLFCDRLSGHRVEVGLIPFGAFGLSAFGIDLYFAIQNYAVVPDAGIWPFISAVGSFRLMSDLFLLGVFAGFFVVPLNALIQERTPAEKRAQVIAANSVLNALFMVLAALISIAMLTLVELSIPEFFLVMALMNIAVAVFIFVQIPEFSMRFLIWLLTHTLYRVRASGLEHVPEKGAAVIVCNHVSFVDALILAGAVRRPIRFIMYKPIFRIPVLNFIFRTGRAIPITSRYEDEQAFEMAFKHISAGLKAGDLLCIFPEGKLTRDGEMNEFKKGIERIIASDPVPVVPMALRGLWGSFFSHHDGGAFRGLPRKIFSRIELVAAEPVAADQVSADLLFERVKALRGDAR
ncbi:MAG: MFS transporter [Pseudomonadales bacterium]|nr:MFS transporter [Pseudomonadales bacterium]